MNLDIFQSAVIEKLCVERFSALYTKQKAMETMTSGRKTLSYHHQKRKLVERNEKGKRQAHDKRL